VLKEELEARQAAQNWKQSGIKEEPGSPLVLHKPQVMVALAEVNAAQFALDAAKTMLDYTNIRAPFDGVIIERLVDPGETLFAGVAVATLYGTQKVEIPIRLDGSQRALLNDSINDAQVILMDLQRRFTWAAEIKQESMHLDPQSRLRTLLVEVKDPLSQKPPLLPGSFLRAEILGRKIPDLLCVPEEARTGQGIVWFVDPDNRLLSRKTKPVFYGEGVVYINAPADISRPVRIAISPNSGFLAGLAVQPIIDKNDEK